MNMDLALFLLAFTMLWKSCQSVRCYKCIPVKEAHLTTPPCSHFNGSDAFVVECNSSTMCFKKVTILELRNGLSGATRSEERGCAPQTWEGDQRKVNGKWKLVNEIYDVYDEACKESTGDYQRATKAVECYCRGDLCNSASSLSISLALFIGIIVSFFNS